MIVRGQQDLTLDEQLDLGRHYGPLHKVGRVALSARLLPRADFSLLFLACSTRPLPSLDGRGTRRFTSSMPMRTRGPILLLSLKRSEPRSPPLLFSLHSLNSTLSSGSITPTSPLNISLPVSPRFDSSPFLRSVETPCSSRPPL